MIYIARGSGHVQIVGLDDQLSLDAKVRQGCLFVIPRFFAFSMVADGEGMEWVSIVTTPEPVFNNLVGELSVLKAISPQILEAALNMSSAQEKDLMSKRKTDSNFFPP